MHIVESHAHLSHCKFDNTFRYLRCDPSTGGYDLAEGDRESILKAMAGQGIVAAIEPGVDLPSNRCLLALAEAHPGFLFPAVGLHPTRAPGESWQNRGVLKELTMRPGVVAIGETGLDFHYPRPEQYRFRQVRWFLFQILLAHRRRLPLILHVRQADRMALFILRLTRPLLHGGVAHCFQGDAQTARAFIRLGFRLGIGGTLLQDNDAGRTLREAVAQIPLEHLLLETDAPYVHPKCDAVPNAKLRSKVRNTPLILPAVAAKIAQLQGTDAETVATRTAENAVKTFRLGKIGCVPGADGESFET